METKEILRIIHESKKKTPVKVYLKSQKHFEIPNCYCFGLYDQIIIGDWEDIKEHLNDIKADDVYVETSARCSAVPLLDIKNLQARIEPGAILREGVQIGQRAVVMMGAILNIASCVGDETMIDMGAVLGARAIIGKRCHIGANAVIAGVLEPMSASPVIIEDDVLVGANAVVLEGIRIGKGAVIAAGAVVIRDVEANHVVAGVPARFMKFRDEQMDDKTKIMAELR